MTKGTYHQNSFGNDSKVTHFKEGAEERLAEALPQTAIWGGCRKVIREDRQKTGRCLGSRRVGRSKEGCASKDKRYPRYLGVKGPSICQ